VGNITDWQDLLQTGRDQSFGYDQLDRLTSAAGAYGELGYSYDDQNRLVGFTQGATEASYGYNGKGERIRKTVNGVTTRFRYAPEGQLLGEYDQQGQPVREYVYLDGQPIALSRSQGQGTAHLLQSVAVDHTPQNVALGHHPVTPVVIAGTPTRNGDNGAVVALSGVSATQVDVRMKEWDYLDGRHAEESFSLMTLPPGLYPQDDGSVWEVGRFTLSGTMQWHRIDFAQAFDGHPYLFLTQQSQNDPETTTIRVRHLDTGGFEAALEEQESLNNGHGEETIGYVAVYSAAGSGSASFYGTSFNYQLTQRRFNHQGVTEGAQFIVLQEEQSRDSELAHSYEAVDILRIDGHTFAQAVSFTGGDAFTLRRDGVTPESTLSGTSEGMSLTYLHTDHLGAVVKATDENGGLVWDVERRPFGERVVGTGLVEVLLGFPGQYFDQETGNYYNYFRDYDPATGRYLQPDPIGLQGGINTYLYAEGNPVINTDPLGQLPSRVVEEVLDCARLRLLVWISCKLKAERCKGTDSCPTLYAKFNLSQDCVYFQTLLTKRCYSANPSHGQVVQDALNRGARCLKMIRNPNGPCQCPAM
jgi:RHS repeat-associated protein